MTKRVMCLLGVKVPNTIKEALLNKEAATGIGMSQQTCEALMCCLGIKDLRKPSTAYEIGIAASKVTVLAD
jgi:uncharacterized protein YwlG (UPF0340 family)